MTFRILLICLCLDAGLTAQTATPEKAGSALLERVCTPCHSLTGVMRQRNTKNRWSEIVDDMVSRGAEAKDAELSQIVDYLVKIRGPKVNVNEAAAEDLTKSAGLPESTAAAIVEYRQKHGALKTLEELKKVPGTDAAAIEQNKDRLGFGDEN